MSSSGCTVLLMTETADFHLTYDETGTPCPCWVQGNEEREPWVGMPHPDEYRLGLRSAFERNADI